MTLKEKIQSDLKEALKNKREIQLSTLRLLSNSIFNKEKEKRYKLSIEKTGLKEKELEEKSNLTEEEIAGVVLTEIKKRKDAIIEFEKGKRLDLVNKETKEMETLKQYLPDQMSEEAVRKTVTEVIEKLGAIEMKDMGKVMAALMPKIKGKAEGSEVSRIVKELLSSK